MRQHTIGRLGVILAAYVLGGFALGLADPALGRVALGLGFAKPGVATAVCVNLLLPLLAIGLAVACPRLATALGGGIGMAGAYTLGLAINYAPPQPWDADTLLGSVKPVLVLACVGYVVLGVAAVVVTRIVKPSDGSGSHTPAI
jgi:hypothetical protein